MGKCQMKLPYSGINTVDASAILGLALGGLIGMVFAWLQLQALWRNELVEQKKEVPGWLRQVPGSMGRVAFLLLAVIMAQVLCPSANVVWMAAGVAIAYAIPFVLRLKDKYFRKK